MRIPSKLIEDKMTKKNSDISITQQSSTNRKLKGYSSGVWETSEIIVGDNEIDNFCHVFLFSVEKEVYSPGCAAFEIQLCFAFAGQLHQWKFKKNTTVHYLIIGKSIIDDIPILSSPSIDFLKQFPAIKLTNYEFDVLQYEFNKIHQEMSMSNILKGIIYARTTIIFVETCTILEDRYNMELNQN